MLSRKAWGVGCLGWVGLWWRGFPDLFCTSCTSTHMLFCVLMLLFWVQAWACTQSQSRPHTASLAFLFLACYTDIHQIVSLSRGDDSSLVLWWLPHRDIFHSHRAGVRARICYVSLWCCLFVSWWVPMLGSGFYCFRKHPDFLFFNFQITYKINIV